MVSKPETLGEIAAAIERGDTRFDITVYDYAKPTLAELEWVIGDEAPFHRNPYIDYPQHVDTCHVFYYSIVDHERYHLRMSPDDDTQVEVRFGRGAYLVDMKTVYLGETAARNAATRIATLDECREIVDTNASHDYRTGQIGMYVFGHWLARSLDRKLKAARRLGVSEEALTQCLREAGAGNPAAMLASSIDQINLDTLSERERALLAGRISAAIYQRTQGERDG